MISKSPRNFYSFPIKKDISSVKLQVLNWANRFNICSFFDNHEYPSEHHSFECLLAAGVKRSLRIAPSSAGPFHTNANTDSFRRLKSFYEEEPDWMFGHFAYDLKNETEALSSLHFDALDFPDLYFFVPEHLVKLRAGEISISSTSAASAEAIWKEISDMPLSLSPLSGSPEPTRIRSRFSKEEYVETVKTLQHHILKGDCYEINFCQEFYAENVKLDPLSVYRNLSRISPNPFSAYYRLDDKYLLCASPERYMRKVKHRVISQPIKGTGKREKGNNDKDQMNKDRLSLSEKERAENIMIVDLVRNDLSRVCEEGSVKVDELFNIYSFPQVYQMISTISGEVNAAVHWTDVIRASFPMGSMTGAPKKKVMELIEKYEKTRRGIYSGALGYITPERDFDFNVVIRSIAFNTTRQYLSYHTGSAITYQSNPVGEYHECLLKAAAIEEVLKDFFAR